MSSNSKKSVGKWISLLHRQFQIYINHEMKQYDINSSEYIYLAAMDIDGVVNQAYLSETLSIDPALTTRVMKSLEKKNYITRTKGTDDKRTIIIKLTDKGREIQPILIEKLSFWTKTLTEGFRDEEQEFVYNSLIKMSENVLNLRKENSHE